MSNSENTPEKQPPTTVQDDPTAAPATDDVGADPTSAPNEAQGSETSEGREASTTPPDAEHPGKATKPPGGGDRDEDAIRRGEDRLDQAAGGH